MADDLDVGSLTTAVQQGFMPNFYTFLYDKGKSFSNSFVSYALCCPSRATFLTGQYAHNHGVLNNDGADGGCAALDASSTLATWLRAAPAPYFTAFVGKYLNGYAQKGADWQSGDPPCWNPTHKPIGWDDWQALVGPATNPGNAQEMYGYRISHNGTLEGPFFEYQTSKLAERAAQAIELGSLQQPFFLSVNPAAAHIEPSQELCAHNWPPFGGEAETIRSPIPYHDDAENIQLPEDDPFNEANVLDKPFPVRGFPPMELEDIACTERVWRDRLESLRLVDELIGTIATTLQNEGVSSNTIVAFTSDNGYFHGEHRLHKKVFPYEEAIRVPLVVRNPASLIRRDFPQFVLNTDYAPTIAAVAGASPPAGFYMDGRSLVTMVIQDQAPATWRKRFLLEHWEGPATEGIPDFFGIRTAAADTLTAPNALYVEYGAGILSQFEYYDRLNDDPYKNQMNNLYGQITIDPDFPTRLAQLKTCAGTGATSCQELEN